MTKIRLVSALGVLMAGLPALTVAATGNEAPAAEKVIKTDHYVLVHSTVPVIAGQVTPIYVREASIAGTVVNGHVPADRLILLIHGANPPSEVAFDLNYKNYSFMDWLARAGYDVFAMDMTGYGRSARPWPMNDPCNLSAKQQAAFVPSLLAAPCPASYGKQLTTIASDWDDISSVVDHLLALRGIDKLNLGAWSLGGMRAGGWAGQHQDKVLRMVLIAPSYIPTAKAEPPAQVPANGAAFNTMTQAEMMENWNAQAGCPNQYEPEASEAVWKGLMDADVVGATWGPGVRRSPGVTVWGWTPALAGATKIPTLLISGATDKTAPPARVRQLYSDLGSEKKVLVDLACSSHNAIWEKNHLLLIHAAIEWLTKGTVNGTDSGIVKLGY